jgi:hypothetical protein
VPHHGFEIAARITKEMLSEGLRLLRLPDRWDASYGGIYHGLDIEGIRQVAERDLVEAAAMAAEALAAARPISMTDCWQDHVAMRLRDGLAQIGEGADEVRIGREALSRDFPGSTDPRPPISGASCAPAPQRWRYCRPNAGCATSRSTPDLRTKRTCPAR